MAAETQADPQADGRPLLEVANVTKHFRTRGGQGRVRAVQDVSFSLRRGETLGIVGESGCGKSTLARVVLRLLEPDSGTVRLGGVDLGSLTSQALRTQRRNMQIIFQDPYASLDPRLTVGAILAEPLVIHKVGDRESRRARVVELMDLVGLDSDAMTRYPHEFSGGQRQRIGIARAIALEPQLVIADEPVSALDVSIQSQILNLLIDLKARLGLSYMFISHDLSVVEHVSDRVAVMYLGQIVEMTDVENLYAHPAHPYTQALLSAIPQTDPDGSRDRVVLPGDIPNPEDPPPGCPFHPRCPRAMDVCKRIRPRQASIGTAAKPHEVTCHLYA